MIEHQLTSNSSIFRIWNDSKNETFCLFLSLTITSLEKCIKRISLQSFSMILFEIKFYLNAFHFLIFDSFWFSIMQKFIKMMNWCKCAKMLRSFWLNCFHISSIIISLKRFSFFWKHEFGETNTWLLHTLKNMKILNNFLKMQSKNKTTWKIQAIYFI